MKVLLVSPQMEKSNGGIAVWTNTYLNGTENTEIKPVLVNTAAVGVRAQNGNAKRNFFDEFIRTKRIFSDLKKTLAKEHFDVAHICTSCGSFGLIRDCIIAKKIKKQSPNTRIILHYHCDIPYQVRRKITRAYLEKILKLSDKNFVLCENSSRYLKEMFSSESITLETILAYYITGLPMDLVHAFGTVLFLMLSAEPMLEKLDRIKVKYGLVE